MIQQHGFEHRKSNAKSIGKYKYETSDIKNLKWGKKNKTKIVNTMIKFLSILLFFFFYVLYSQNIVGEEYSPIESNCKINLKLAQTIVSFSLLGKNRRS